MQKMSEDEFDKLEYKISPKDCMSHCAVKITDFAGAHNDFGCIKCGLKHSDSKVFYFPGLTGYK